MNPSISKMQTAADTLLEVASEPGELRTAAHELSAALIELASWNEQSPGAEVKTALDTGLAIAPMDAARCILDFQRTACFLRGTLAAIEAAQAQTKETVEVLYAGCGPLAPLAVALCHRVRNVRFWPVDIHPMSVESVARLVSKAGYEKFFGEIVVADAAAHCWPQKGSVAIVEVMLRALEKEPQVAVTANLANQLVDGGVIVPEAVRLDVQLFNPATEFDLGETPPLERVRVPVGHFLELNARTASDLLLGHEAEFEVVSERPLSLLVSTQIVVQGKHVLNDYDSGLTAPWVASEMGTVEPGARIQIRLVQGALPSLEVEKISP